MNKTFKEGQDWTHKVIVFPPNVATVYCANFITGYVNIDFIYIPGSLITISGSKMFGRAPKILILDFPPRFSPSLVWNGTQSTLAIYVPDAYLNDWKTNSSWSSQANNIHPLSEYTGVRYWETHSSL